MSNDFPILLTPDKIKSILTSRVSLPELPPNPKEPKEPSKPSFSGTTFYYLIVGLFFIYIGQSIHDKGFFLIIGMVSIIIFLAGIVFTIQDYNNYPDEKIKYSEAKRKYYLELNTYNSAIVYIESYKIRLEDRQFESKEKYKLIHEELKKTLKPEVEFVARKGYSEIFFHAELSKWFPNEVLINRAIETFPPQWRKIQSKDGNDYYSDGIYENYVEVNPYVPDFIFCHIASNLCIVIEIDEPYSLTEKTPIHYLYSKADRVRNEYFANKGYFVLRFAEEQVINQPLECCRLLAQLIFKITRDNSYLSKIPASSDVSKVPQWTKEQAIEMAQKNYRHQYLKKILR